MATSEAAPLTTPDGATAQSSSAHAAGRRERASAIAVPIGMAVLVIALAFSAGGFFAGATALLAVVLGIGLLLWLTIAARPLAGLGPALGLAATGLGLFALWTLASALWSDSAARALLEFDRALAYLLGVVLAGLIVRATADRRRLVWGFAIGVVVVCGAALVTRLLPEVWSVYADRPERLAYPVSYWNALGLLAGLGLVALLHLSASLREPVPVRVLAAGAAPVLACALFFTFSRGAIAMVPIGLIALLVLARPRGALSALVATVPAVAITLVVSYGSDALSSSEPATAAGIAEGKDLAFVLVVCVLVAAGLRAALLPLDARLARLRVGRERRRRLVAVTALVAVAVVAVGAVALDAPGRIADQVDRFSSGDELDVSTRADSRKRLLEVGNNGRIEHWEVALDGLAREPLRGEGAGTYALTWDRYRSSDFEVVDAHSLPLEVLGELGVVGFVLLALGLGALLVGGLRAARGRDRDLGAVAVALLLVWLGHASIDWQWEMPVVTLPVLALAAAIVSARRERVAEAVAAPPRLARLLVGLGCLVLVVSPALVFLSQRSLDRAVGAFRAGDCGTAVDQALAVNELVSIRHEPFEVLGYCNVRLGQPALAVRAFEAAVRRDPRNWRTHYGLALVRAASGIDPRSEVLVARRLNPLSELTAEVTQLFDSDDPETWKRRATRARLPN